MVQNTDGKKYTDRKPKMPSMLHLWNATSTIIVTALTLSTEKVVLYLPLQIKPRSSLTRTPRILFAKKH